VLKTKIWANFQRIIELFTKKIVKKLLKNGFGIRDLEKTYSGSRIQGSKRHRIPDPDPQHCRIQCFIDLKKKCGSRQTNITESVANSTCVADPEPVSALAPPAVNSDTDPDLDRYSNWDSDSNPIQF
jgi:hypothetical protein